MSKRPAEASGLFINHDLQYIPTSFLGKSASVVNALSAWAARDASSDDIAGRKAVSWLCLALNLAAYLRKF